MKGVSHCSAWLRRTAAFIACSVLVDMTKTAGDFRAAAHKELEAVADGLLPRLRPILDEVGTVRQAQFAHHPGCMPSKRADGPRDTRLLPSSVSAIA